MEEDRNGSISNDLIPLLYFLLPGVIEIVLGFIVEE